jgi:hypothetical protein
VRIDQSNTTAVRLTGQIDDLSRALAHAGVPLAERARLLELAALAAMQAVVLDASGAGAEVEREEPAPVTPIAEAPSLRETAAA